MRTRFGPDGWKKVRTLLQAKGIGGYTKKSVNDIAGEHNRSRTTIHRWMNEARELLEGEKKAAERDRNTAGPA